MHISGLSGVETKIRFLFPRWQMFLGKQHAVVGVLLFLSEWPESEMEALAGQTLNYGAIIKNW